MRLSQNEKIKKEYDKKVKKIKDEYKQKQREILENNKKNKEKYDSSEKIIKCLNCKHVFESNLDPKAYYSKHRPKCKCGSRNCVEANKKEHVGLKKKFKCNECKNIIKSGLDNPRCTLTSCRSVDLKELN